MVQKMSKLPYVLVTALVAERGEVDVRVLQARSIEHCAELRVVVLADVGVDLQAGVDEIKRVLGQLVENVLHQIRAEPGPAAVHLKVRIKPKPRDVNWS